MIHIHNISELQDCHLLTHNPDLQREVTSYLLYCRYEIQQYCGEDDDISLNFMVLAEADLPILDDLGTPEETVQISIKADGHIITIYRIVYPTEVIFIPAKASTQFSF